MDRPEDVEPNPKTGKVYVMLTNNTRRTAEQVDAANPRADNAFGHIVEMTPPDGDHGAPPVHLGDPGEVRRSLDRRGGRHLQLGHDQGRLVRHAGQLRHRRPRAGSGSRPTATATRARVAPTGSGRIETEGEARGTSKHFFRCPVGAELCGPVFTQDDRSLFLAVQHPSDDTDAWTAFGRLSTFEDPGTRWPDFAEDMPPRPSIVVVTKEDDGPIGS